MCEPKQLRNIHSEVFNIIFSTLLFWLSPRLRRVRFMRKHDDSERNKRHLLRHLSAVRPTLASWMCDHVGVFSVWALLPPVVSDMSVYSVKSMQFGTSAREVPLNVCENAADLCGIGLTTAVRLMQQSVGLVSEPVWWGEKWRMHGERDGERGLMRRQLAPKVQSWTLPSMLSVGLFVALTTLYVFEVHSQWCVWGGGWSACALFTLIVPHVLCYFDISHLVFLRPFSLERADQ